MICKDYECEDCGDILETYITTMKHIPKNIKCHCGGKANAIISLSATNVYTGNQDAQWLKSVRDVVDKDPAKPHCQRFLQNPNRDNYKSWMKGEGLRPYEQGESRKPPPVDVQKLTESTMKRQMERKAISI